YTEFICLSLISTSCDRPRLNRVDHTRQLVPGQVRSVSRTVTIPATTTPGQYFVLVVGDALKRVAESNETNNVAATRLTVGSPPPSPVGSPPPSPVGSPPPSASSLAVSPTIVALSVAQGGSPVSVPVTVTTNVAWTATSNQPWLKATPSVGAGNVSGQIP